LLPVFGRKRRALLRLPAVFFSGVGWHQSTRHEKTPMVLAYQQVAMTEIFAYKSQPIKQPGGRA